jgi:Acyclic terpene utilisation family protein AtuA
LKTVRLGAGMAFWGDSIKPAIQMVQSADIDYLCCDHLAELTMSILSKRMERDPDAGYTPDIVDLMRAVLPKCLERGIKIISNAGGANPRSCALRVAEVCKELGLSGVRIGVVTGDDIREGIDTLMAEGVSFASIDTGAGLDSVRERLTHANVYVGADGIVEALEAGADIVICGRVTDVALYIGPMRHEFGWAADDWHRLGIAAGVAHCIECGAQATGGLYAGGWQHVEGMADIGYPIAEVSEDGSAVITKTPGSGGEVTVGTVSEQMVYEILDPGNYLTADVTGDFSGIALEQVGPDRVKVSGLTGKPAPATLKVNMGYRAGFIGTAQWTYTWPDAYLKAKRSISLLEERLAAVDFQAEATRVEWVGHNSMWAPLVGEPDDADLLEVTVRYAARCPSREQARKVFSELVPICNNGPAGLGGLGTRLPITELFAVWPCLISRDHIKISVDLVEV